MSPTRTLPRLRTHATRIGAVVALVAWAACDRPPVATELQDRNSDAFGAPPGAVPLQRGPSLSRSTTSDGIVQVSPSSLTVTGLQDLQTLELGNYDGVVTAGDLSFAERFAGQTLSYLTVSEGAGQHDMLSGEASSPLTLAAGAASQNVGIFTSSGASSGSDTRVIAGLGPKGFPAGDAIGEGSVAVLFASDQAEVGFDVLGAQGNATATVTFFRRDGSLVGTVVIASLSSQSYGFRRDGGVHDVAGFSIHNDDGGGIGFDNFRYSSGPTPIPFSLRVDPASDGVLVTATDIDTGEALYQHTDANGIATFNLLPASYIFTARRLATTNATALQIWPHTAGIPVDSLDNFVGAVLGGGSSQLLTPENFNRAFVSPYVISAPQPPVLARTLSLSVRSTPPTLALSSGASIACTLLDADGNPLRGAELQLFGVMPYTNTEDLPPTPASFGGDETLPRGLGYGVNDLRSDGTCSFTGAPAGTTVLETPPVQTSDGPVKYVITTTVTEGQASGGAVIEQVAGPSPILASTAYFSDDAGDAARSPRDIAGAITAGFKPVGGDPSDVLAVTTSFRGSGNYTLEIWTDGAPGTSLADPDYVLTANCAGKRCMLLPASPKAPAGTSVTGVVATGRGGSPGTVTWSVRLPEVSEDEAVSFRIGNDVRRQHYTDTAPDLGVFQVIRKGGGGNTFLIMGTS